MASALSPKDVAQLPLPGTSVPTGAAFSPDGRVLTYLYDPDGGLQRRLFVLDLDPDRRPAGSPPPPTRSVPVGAAMPADEAALSTEERLRRERAREVGHGVTQAVWATGGDAVLVPLPDGLHVVHGLAARPGAPTVVRAVAADGMPGALVGACLSPDGTMVAFSCAGELHVAPTDGSAPARRLTTTATDGLANGVAEFVAQEEMGRSHGLWWAPDGGRLAYAEVDERHVPRYRIVHQGSDRVGPEAEEVHRYPFAGQANAVVRLGVVPVGGGDTVWMETGDPDGYLARVHWTPAGRLLAQLQPRHQAELRLVALDPASGAAVTVHTERGEPWVNLHDDFRPLADGGFLWSSERTGTRHLEVRAADGALVRVLTEGPWQVDGVEAVDEAADAVLFTGRRDGARQRHLYTVALSGGAVRRLTPEPGTHLVTVSTTAGLFVDRHASLAVPPAVRVRSLADAAVVATVHDRRDPRIDRLGLEPPEPVDVPADDGTVLHGLLYRAPTVPASLVPAPLVVAVYGGPHVQLAVDDWGPTVAMRAQALRQRGVHVLTVDNRGSANRGLVFERPVWRRLGRLEVADQVAGVRWAVAAGLADPDRVGVYGWSYGGYMALRCLGVAPGTFRAAVAGAPVTAWDGYDTHYTERYMGTPEDNPDGYQASSAVAVVEAMRGDLLLVHGLLDENVHFRHTARLLARLVAAGKDHDLLLFPGERHLPRGADDRAYMEDRVLRWLLRALGLGDG